MHDTNMTGPKEFKLLTPLTGLFVAVLLVSNVTSQKMFAIGPFVSGGGIILFPIAYIFNDILTETYGYVVARKVIWTGVFCQLLAASVYALVEALPPADFWPHQEAYQTILGIVPRIAIGSICGYFCGAFANAIVLAKLKVQDRGKKLGKRFVLSTIVGEAVDTAVFMAVAFLGVLPPGGFLRVAVTAYIFKVAYEVVMVPWTTRIAGIVKSIEGVDVYDSETRFSPFAIFQRSDRQKHRQ